MARYAIVNRLTGTVENVVEGTSEWAASQSEYVLPADDDTEGGGFYDGERFHRPPRSVRPEIPPSAWLTKYSAAPANARADLIAQRLQFIQ